LSEESGDFAPANGIRLWYRDEGNPAGDPILLIMGLGSQLIAWPDDFVGTLTKQGFRVIRFDNRDSGLSEKIVPSGPAWLPPYLLRDMARDAAGLLDYLHIENAHVVGASMGGMIAQLVAIEHTSRVRSLCSIMSTTGDRSKGLPTKEATAAVLKPTPPEPAAAIAHIAWVMGVIGSQTLAEVEAPARLAQATAAYDRSFFPAGTQRQFEAIMVASNRTEGLAGLTVPTLVVHGDEDSLIDVSGGIATAEAVPGAQFLRLPTMGHDLPASLRPQILKAIVANTTRALANA
jgi:pimeloyl-ACP methyl ester carboxylesterase